MLSAKYIRPNSERRGLPPPYCRAKPGGSLLMRGSVAVRRGLSLLEVLLAMGIFLLTMVALTQLVILAGDRALDVKMQSQAVQMAQTKMAEVVAGVQPLNGQSGMPFDEDPDWTWSLDVQSVQSNGVTGLSQVTVHVSRSRPDGTKLDFVLSQYVMDPTMRGSSLTIAQLPLAGSMSSKSSTGSASSGSAAAGGAAGAAGGATKGGATKGGGAGPAPKGGGGAAPKGGSPAPAAPSAPAAPKKGG